MRIIGGKDFYDNALAFGRDEDVVFVRNKEKLSTNAEVPFYNPLYRENQRFDWRLAKFVFYIAGKRYYMIRAEKYTTQFECHYFWTKEAFKKFDNDNFPQYSPRRIWRKRGEESIINEFDMQISDQVRDWLIANRITIMHSHFADGLNNPCWIVDPFDLYKYELQKHVNHYQLFQEISMWVGGVLPRNPNPMVEITDDKIKTAKHGYDKWSFRKQGVHSK